MGNAEREEEANCFSPALAFALTVVTAPFIAATLPRHAGAERLPAFIVFEVSMALLYLSSSIFHGLPAGRAKFLFERVDRAAIHVFIAGSYSLFALPTLAGERAWLAFLGVWACAGIGAIVTLWGRARRPLWTALPYLVVGWLALLGVATQTGPMHDENLALLVLGGVAYTLGAAVYVASSRLHFAHLAWHVLVMLGSGLHLAAAVA
jgi:hemolysin III